MKHVSAYAYVLGVFLSLLVIVLSFFLQEKLLEFRSFGLFGIFLINFFGSATIFFPAPAIVSVVAGGGVYHPLAVAFLSALGAALGDMSGFLLGYSGKHIIVKEEKTWYVMVRKYFKRFGSLAVLLFAFIPNPFFDIIGIVAGAFAYSPYRFFALLFLGRFLRDIILAYAGSAFF